MTVCSRSCESFLLFFFFSRVLLKMLIEDVQRQGSFQRIKKNKNTLNFCNFLHELQFFPPLLDFTSSFKDALKLLRGRFVPTSRNI